MKLKSILPLLLGFLPAALIAWTGPASGGPKIIKSPEQAKPAEISARYSISLNGFDLGSLDFKAKSGPDGYNVTSDVSISALLGAFTWHGVTKASGKVTEKTYRPQDYQFDYTSTSRSGSVRMGFDSKAVTSLKVEPLTFMAPDEVPLEREHLAGVLDPLSAIMTMTKADPSNACNRTLALFDGKQRFNLSLSFRRQEPLDEASGSTELATVCRIKYTPIAGFRDNEDARALAKETGIEIAFRSVPAAAMMVPHKVTLPTMAGNAIIKAERVSINFDGAHKVAHAND